MAAELNAQFNIDVQTKHTNCVIQSTPLNTLVNRLFIQLNAIGLHPVVYFCSGDNQIRMHLPICSIQKNELLFMFSKYVYVLVPANFDFLLHSWPKKTIIYVIM